MTVRDKPKKTKQIIDAAIRVFATKGYHGCRIADVAEEAGVAYGLVYHYYGNKERLLRTIFDTHWRIFASMVEEIVDRPQDADSKIREIIDFVLERLGQLPLVFRVMVMEFGLSTRRGDALDDPEVNRVFNAMRKLFRQYNEELRPVDDLSAAMIFLGALESAVMNLVVPGDSKKVAEPAQLEKTRETLYSFFCQ